MTELTGGQDVARELLNAAEAHIEAWRHDFALVDASDQVLHKLARPLVVHDLQIVAMLLRIA